MNESRLRGGEGRRSWERSDRSPSRYDGQFRPEFSRLHRDPDLLWATPIGVRYILGVVGLRGAGKSTVLSYLAEKRGFETYSLSMVVRKEADRRGLPLRRDLLQDLGDEIRADAAPSFRDPAFGGGYFGRAVLQRIHERHHAHTRAPHEDVRIAVSGFKHPDEVRVFAPLRRFRALLVDCSDNVRARRARQTGLLPRELNELGIEGFPRPPQRDPGESDEQWQSREAEYIREMDDLFFEHLDARDRDGAAHSPWASGHAQAADRVVADARAALDHEAEESTSEETTLRINNDHDFADEARTLDNSLHRQIDEIVSRLDQEFPSR